LKDGEIYIGLLNFAIAKVSHPRIKDIPPIGVIIPNLLSPVKAIPYKEPTSSLQLEH